MYSWRNVGNHWGVINCTFEGIDGYRVVLQNCQCLTFFSEIN